MSNFHGFGSKTFYTQARKKAGLFCAKYFLANVVKSSILSALRKDNGVFVPSPELNGN